MTSSRKTMRGLALAAVAAVTLAACSSQGGAQNQPDAAGQAGLARRFRGVQSPTTLSPARWITASAAGSVVSAAIFTSGGSPQAPARATSRVITVHS